MPNYLVESYLPRAGLAFERASEHARGAADFADRNGLGVRYVRTTFLEADETCFHVFDADSLRELEAALAGAQLEVDRIVKADETFAADAAPTEAAPVSTKGQAT
jgi:hypothetical protein